MPVYEYKCVSCGSTYDVFHRGREVAEDIVCPSCSSTEHKKLMSASAVATKASHASPAPSCDTGGGCCGGGMCGMN
jgi:putative FmdB family regulatory protein